MKSISLITSMLMAVFLGQVIGTELGVNGLAVGGALFVANAVFVRPVQGALHELTISDTSYAGTVLEQFLSLVSTSFDTVEKGCMNILPGIKKKATIPTINIDAFIQAYNPEPSHGGTATVDARTLETQDFMGFLKFLPRDFEQHWMASKLNPKLMDAALPKSAESAIIQEVIKYNKSYMDKAVWQSEKDDAAIATALASGLAPGDNNLIFLDGLQRKLYLDGDVTKVAAPSAITKANVITKMEAVAAEIPSAVYDDPNFKFLLAGANKKAYTDSQKDQTNKGVDFTREGVMEFDGKPVVAINGMSPGTIYGGKASTNLMSNLWLGVNDIDEDEYLKIAKLNAAGDYWFLKMLFKIDVNHAFGEECAVHMTETFL